MIKFLSMNKATAFVFALAFAAYLIGCNEKKANKDVVRQDNVPTIKDSTIYGVCGEGTAMHTLQLITDVGDTLEFAISDEGFDSTDVQGGLMAGDRMAVVGKQVDGANVATSVINLTTLLGHWTSVDRNFEIQEGGTIKSNVKAETSPWTTWKILNGRLLLNKDTFKIDMLGADSLYLENRAGIFAYKRQI